CLRTAAATRSFGTGLMPDVVTSVEFMRTAIIFRARYWSARSSRETGVFSRPKYAAICSARRPEALIHSSSFGCTWTSIATRAVAPLEAREPLGAVACAKGLLERRAQRVVPLHAVGLGRKPRVREQVRALDRLGERLPELRRRRQVDGERLAVPRDERVRLRASRARAEVRDLAEQEVVRERLGEERHARRQHAHLDPLPLPRPRPRRERREDAVRGVEPGEL